MVRSMQQSGKLSAKLVGIQVFFLVVALVSIGVTLLVSPARELWMRTDFEAPRNRVVAVSLTRPARTAWRTVAASSSESPTRACSTT